MKDEATKKSQNKAAFYIDGKTEAMQNTFLMLEQLPDGSSRLPKVPTYYLLLLTCYLLLTTHYLLTTYYSLLTHYSLTHYLLLTTYYVLLLTTYYLLLMGASASRRHRSSLTGSNFSIWRNIRSQRRSRHSSPLCAHRSCTTSTAAYLA